MPVGYLVLENGKIFKGELFGVPNEVTGEIVFSTNLFGYMETITDKNNYKKIVVQTFPLVGNYGVVSAETISETPQISGYIVKSLCETPSNFQSEGTLNDYFIKHNLTGLQGIDTRALVKIIRDAKSLNGKITSNLDKIDYTKIKQFKIFDAVKDVSCKEFKLVKSKQSLYKVAVLDFGINENLKDELLKRGFDLYIFPYNSPVDLIKKIEPNGIILSDGPFEENPEIIRNLKELTKCNIPVFGINSGHILLALSNGFSIEKLTGHRGGQAVKDLETEKIYITNQNHAYAVTAKSVAKKNASISFVNVNDGTVEGITYKKAQAFSVQFCPALETDFLFDKFVNLMEAYNAAK